MNHIEFILEIMSDAGYKQITLTIDKKKAEKLASLKPTMLTAEELRGSSDHIFVHSANYEKIMKAKKANRGVKITMASGEILFDMDERQGASVWSWLKNKAWPWLKRNYDVIKPVLSRVADAAIPAAATYLGQPQLGVAGREALRQLSGVGVASKKLGKGSPEMKEKMAKLRSMRKGGSLKAGSFRL